MTPPSLPTSSLGLILDAPNVHPVLACALRGVLAADPGEVAWGLGSGWLLPVLPTCPCLCLSLLEGREAQGQGRARASNTAAGNQDVHPPQTPPILVSTTSFIKFSLSMGSLPALPTPKAHCITRIGVIPGQEEAGCG